MSDNFDGYDSFGEYKKIDKEAWRIVTPSDLDATALASVGDVKSDARGSGARYNKGKPDYSLIPLATMADEARVWAYGKAKYAAWNWAKGQDWDVPFACLMRHLAAWQAGEELDPESLLPHLAHAMCNLRMLTLFAKNYPEGDTRPTQWLADYRNDFKKGIQV